MRTLFLITLLLSYFTGFGQSKLIVLDVSSNQPVISAHLLDKHEKVIAISNVNGELWLERRLENMKLVHPGYEIEQLNVTELEEIDTIFLIPHITDLDEVTIVGMTNEDLYEKIIKNTHTKINHPSYKGRMNYFISNYFIITDTLTGIVDTMIVSSEANFRFLAQGKSNNLIRNYSFYPLSGKRYVESFNQEKNKNRFNENPTFLKPKFDYFGTLFDYELSSVVKLMMKKRGAELFSERHIDSISYLHFKEMKGDYISNRYAYYSKSDTTLSDYKLYGKNEFGNYFVSAEYNNIGQLYFLKNAQEEMVVNVNLGARTLKTITVHSITIEDLESVENKDLNMVGGSVNVMEYINELPFSDERIPMYMLPSK